jgi:hypothetical protein
VSVHLDALEILAMIYFSFLQSCLIACSEFGKALSSYLRTPSESPIASKITPLCSP